MRRLWAEESVDHSGTFFQYESLHVEPKPTKPLDVWLGGKAPSELKRVGRLGDGWLASFATPEICAQSRPTIEEAASAHRRAIDPEHFGAMVFYAHEPLPDALAKIIAARTPNVDPRDLVPSGWSAVRTRCEEFVAVGFSKLVLVPFGAVTDWSAELATAADALLDLQN